jgi:hypothetical protein
MEEGGGFRTDNVQQAENPIEPAAPFETTSFEHP